MEPDMRQWIGYLPLLIFAGVMLWRFRSLDRARHLRVSTMWIMPAFILGMIGFALYGMHPTTAGWLAVAGGLTAGGLLGAQRARMMRLHIEGEGAKARVMMRHSAAALIMIVGIFALRRLLLPAMSPGGGSAHTAASALLVTDAMLGFAAGVICMQRVVLWLRARRLVTEHFNSAE